MNLGNCLLGDRDPTGLVSLQNKKLLFVAAYSIFILVKVILAFGNLGKTSFGHPVEAKRLDVGECQMLPGLQLILDSPHLGFGQAKILKRERQ